MTTFAPTVEGFFAERLIAQRQVSGRTVIAYRDTVRMLLAWAEQQTGKSPSQLDVADVSYELVSSFLTHLEHDRGNVAQTRNTRLAAIRSLFRYAALKHPEHAASIQQVLAIPTKRYDRREVCYLDPDEVDALLAAPDLGNWLGRRDHALLILAVQTGLRVSELTGLNRGDLQTGPGAFIRCRGKGRKARQTPLTKSTVVVLREWLKEHNVPADQPLFPTLHGTRLSADAVQWLVAKYARTAAAGCATLRTKSVSPHVLRHTCAAYRFAQRRRHRRHRPLVRA